MNSVELLEYYQKKSGYPKSDYRDLDRGLDTIFKDVRDEFSDEDIKAIKNLMFESIKKCSKDLPTQYQDPNMYFLLDSIFKRINEAACEMSESVELTFPEKITYGTVHEQFAARVESCDCKGDYLLMVSDCVFMFANLLSKSMGLLLMDDAKENKEGAFSYSLSKEAISNALQNNFNAIIRFTDLVLAYIVTGQASMAKQYTPGIKLAAITELIRDSYELFVVGHEYSHILLGHFQRNPSENKFKSEVSVDEDKKYIVNNWIDEHSADYLSTFLTIKAMKGFDFVSSYMGIDICLITLIILERISVLLGIGSDNTSHPPAELRRDLIFKFLLKENEDIKSIYEINTFIVDSLWDRCMYIITEINDFYEKKLKIKITDINYHFTRTLLYKIGEIILVKYNKEHSSEQKC